MASRTVTFIFDAVTDGLTGGVQAAQGAVQDLSTSFAQTDRQLRDLGRRMQATKATTDKMQASMSKAQEALGALGSAAAVVNPELGQMFQEASALVGGAKSLVIGFEMLGDVLAATGAAFIPVTLAVGALATAAIYLANETAKAREDVNDLDASLEMLNNTLDAGKIEAAAKAWERFQDVVDDIYDDFLDLNDFYTKGEKYILKRIEQIDKEAEANLRLVATQYAQLEVERQLLKNKLETNKLSFEEEAAIRLRLDALKEEIPAAQERIDLVKEEIAQAKEEAKLVGEAIDQKDEDAKAERELEKAKRARGRAAADAAKEELEASKELEEARKAEERRLTELGAALESIQAVRETYTMKALEGEDLIAAREQQALEDLRERYNKAAALAGENEAEILANLQAFEEAKAAILADGAERRRKAREAEAEAEAAEREERIEANKAMVNTILNDTLSVTQTMLDKMRDYRTEHGENMTKEEKKQLNKRIKQTKRAMKVIAIAQKAAGIIDIAIKTAQGVMAVWAEFGAYPPVAAALSAIVGTAGTASAAAVASQKVEFHRGGVVDAKLLDGEAVLNRQATQALTPQGVDALNSGKALMPNISFRIGRQEAREIIRTDVRSGGMVTQEIGRIANTSGNVGLSGLPVLA